MKWIILGLLVVSGILFVLSWLADKSGHSEDEKLGALIPGIPAAVCLALAVALALGYAVYRALFD